MNTVDLKDEYRTEMNEDVYSEDTHYGGTGSYSDEYVKWLESKLNNNEVLDIVSKRELLNELINNQEEIISSPIRFNGVSIEKLKQIFEKNGVKYELPF